jgi:peptidyl-prolyl cis-trans isomerase C
MLCKRVVVAALIALIGACGVRDKDLVAKVNGQGVTKKQFEAEVERNLARYKGQGHELPPGIETRIRESVLRRMIDDAIIEQKAKSVGADVSNEELEGKFKEHKDRFRTAEAFDDYLKRSGNTIENMKDDLRRNLLRDRVVEKLSGTVDVADDEVKKYYDENVQRFTEREQIRASRILIRVMPNATPAEKKAAQKEASDILAKLKKGGDFAALAKEKSKGPEAANGGDLGWLTRGRMTPEFDTVAFGPAAEPTPPVAPGATPPKPAAPAAKGPAATGLKADEMSGVVETKLGYEIIKVFEKKAERQRPLDEVKESIKGSLLARKRNDKRRDVLRTLKGDAQVEQLVKFEPPPPPAGTPPSPVATPGVIPPAPGTGGGGPTPPGSMPPPTPSAPPPPAAGSPAPATP